MTRPPLARIEPRFHPAWVSIETTSLTLCSPHAMTYYQNLWCVPCILVVSQVAIAWTQSSLAVGRPSPRLDMPHATGVGLIDSLSVCFCP